ncbi:MAG: type II toxin-antitoxin system HicB family antitoxin [Clostridia bacterium]|nr:type II toxin-antitoxin system HicB family antitoxin [Clostridia bacterium]
MKTAYPIVMSKDEKYIVVYIPDFDIYSQGKDYAEAIEMARDAIGLMGIDYEDDGKALPKPTEISDVKCGADDIISLVDIDFAEYRRKNDMRSVRRNVTLPAWLDYAAEKSGINVSAVLQRALKEELNITETSK